MLPVESGIEPVKAARKEKNGAVKAEIRETLENTAPGQSFVIVGAVKKNMVKVIAIAMNLKVKIAVGTDGKLRCWRM